MTLTALERGALEAFRSGAPMAQGGDGPDAWVGWGLGVTLRACRLVRHGQARLVEDAVRMKSDDSPVTQVESDVEAMVIDTLAAFAPGARFVGEESGGAMREAGVTVAVDPIDGTWAYLTGTETFATTLAVIENGAAILGIVANPMTGTIVYATPGRTRRLRVSAFGEPDAATTLPVTASATKVLVNCHPSRDTGGVIRSLYGEWRAGRVQVVRSPGGSPSWALAEAAAGGYVYVNLWSTAAAAPYDLMAGVLAVRGAGGDVVDLDGRPIDPAGHAGPFVAGAREAQRAAVRRVVAASA